MMDKLKHVEKKGGGFRWGCSRLEKQGYTLDTNLLMSDCVSFRLILIQATNAALKDKKVICL